MMLFWFLIRFLHPSLHFRVPQKDRVVLLKILHMIAKLRTCLDILVMLSLDFLCHTSGIAAPVEEGNQDVSIPGTHAPLLVCSQIPSCGLKSQTGTLSDRIPPARPPLLPETAYPVHSCWKFPRQEEQFPSSPVPHKPHECPDPLPDTHPEWCLLSGPTLCPEVLLLLILLYTIFS